MPAGALARSSNARLINTRTFLLVPRRSNTQRTPSAYHSSTVTIARIGITIPPATK